MERDLTQGKIGQSILLWYKNRKMVQVKNTAFAVFFISYFD